jgi:hypothetical protein
MEDPLSTRLALIALMILAAAPCAAQTGAPSPSDSTAAAPWPVVLTPPTPPDFPRGRISGFMFGDLYYNTVGDPHHLYDSRGVDQGQVNIDGKKTIGKDLNGVQMRRVYFQLDNDLTPRFSTRFRLEVDSRELTSGGKIGAFLKNAYLLSKSVAPRADLYFGLIGTPTFENAEAFWQYRAIEKTMLDFLGLRPASDLGLALKGYADSDHHIGYAAMMGDGPGQKPENDRFKTWYFSLPVRYGELRIEPYVDYQVQRVNPNATAVSDTVMNTDQATYKVFAGYEFRRWALGGEAFSRLNHGGNKPNAELRGLSIFGRGTLVPGLAAFARFDGLQNDVNNPNRVDSQLWIAGVDWQPLKDIHVMPNVEATQYIAKGTAVAPPHHDLQARVTFYYLFSRPQN